MLGGARGTTARGAGARPWRLARATPVGAAELAWLGAVPCAAILLGAIAWLGPALGAALPQAGHVRFWTYLLFDHAVRPEPTEHARYLLALGGALLLPGAVALAGRERERAIPGGRLLARAGEAAVVVAAAACLAAPHLWPAYGEFAPRVYFTWRTLAVALAFGALAFAVASRRPLAGRVAVALRETPRRRVAAALVAVLFTAVWLLAAVNTDATIGATPPALWVNIPFWLDEPFAVLNGLAPLATFHAQYSQLLPYLGAAAMALFGQTLAVFSLTMASATGAAMLAVFALLRRVTRSALAALLLYMPFLATSFFKQVGSLDDRWAPVNAFSMFPIRYGGAYVLAWLTGRHLDGARPRGRAALFVAAGLVAIDNPEFGLPALGATLAALLWTTARPPRATLARLALDTALGLVVAAALVAGLTLAAGGELPRFGTLFLFGRLYGVEGLMSLPIPSAIGLHVAIYLTFAAALAVGTVRAVAGREDRVLTGMLVWAGIFGLGAASYYVGRSHPEVLIDLFSAWALALALLAVVAVRGLRASGPSFAALAPLVGVGLALCSVAQTPLPWRQVARLRRAAPTPASISAAAQEPFVRRETRPGERVAILGPLGHRIAQDVGVADVTPYATLESMYTRELLEDELARLRAERISTVFLLLVPTTQQEHLDALRRAGYVPVGQTPTAIALRRRAATDSP